MFDFVYDFEIVGIDYQFLFGGDYYNVEIDYDYYCVCYEVDGVVNLNIFIFNYGEIDLSIYNLINMNCDGLKCECVSFYLQDKL